MISVTHGSVTVPVGRKKFWTALGANQIAGFVTVSSEKKNYFLSLVMQIPKKVPQQRYMTSRLEMCAWFHFPTRVSFISSLLCHAPRIQKCHIATLKLEK